MNGIGKAIGNKPKVMKCKLETGAGVNIMPLSIYKPLEFDEQGKPTNGHGQYRTIQKDYNGNLIQQYGIRVILGKWNHQYWRFVFRVVEAEVPILLGLNMRKMGLFTRHPRVLTDIHQEQQNQARCNPMEVESTTIQGAAGPASEIQCSRPADYNQTPTGQGYVNPRSINNKISVSFSEGWSSAVSLQNGQLRTTFQPSSFWPTMKQWRSHNRPDRSTADMIHMPRSSHSSYPYSCKATGPLDQEMVYLRRGPIKGWDPHSYLVKTAKGVQRQNRI